MLVAAGAGAAFGGLLGTVSTVLGAMLVVPATAVRGVMGDVRVAAL